MCPSSCPPAHCAGTGTPQPGTDPPPAAPSQETQLHSGMCGVKVGWGGGGGLGLTCSAGEVHAPVASGIQHEREAAEAVVRAVRVQTLAVDAVHFILTLVLVCPRTRTEQCFRLADMGNATLSPPSPLLCPGRATGSLSPGPGPVAWAAGTTLGAAAWLSLCTRWEPPLLFEDILPTHSSLLES